MSNETIAPVASVTLPTGAVITADMSPLERYNIVAKAHGAAEAPRPEGPQFGPRGMTNGTVAELARREATASAQRDASGRTVASKPAEQPAAPAPIEAPRQSVAQPDQALIKALNAAYRALPPDQRASKTAQYQMELAEAYEGRRLGETRGEFTARAYPSVTALSPEEMNYNAALDRAVAAQDNNGVVDHAALDPALLHGYTIPAGKYALKDLVDGLKICRSRGVSQARVNQIIEDTWK